MLEGLTREATNLINSKAPRLGTVSTKWPILCFLFSSFSTLVQ
jgi:hypothetical protein